jgi:hypothetical protein
VSTITGFETHDIRSATSRHLDRSDAMNPFPDASAACPHAGGVGLCELVLFTFADGPARTGPAEQP